METVEAFFSSLAEKGLVSMAVQQEARRRFQLSHREAEERILAMDLLPVRYVRSREIFSAEQQRTLLNSRVAVIGCGSLGGCVVEELACLGVGSIIVVDPDMQDEHSLNRPFPAVPGNPGTPKAAAAVRRAKAINPAINAIAMVTFFTEENGEDLLMDVQVVVDALDSIPARLELARVCDGMGIPLVHGSVAGWYGMVATQYPGERIVERLFSNASGTGVSVAGPVNTSFTPLLVAGIEVVEISKILLGQGRTLRGRLLSINLIDMEIVGIDLRQ